MSRVISEAERQRAVYKWLNTRRAAERLGVSVEHVRLLIDDKELRAMDVSRDPSRYHEYRIKPEWCDEFEARRTSGPTQGPAATLRGSGQGRTGEGEPR